MISPEFFAKLITKLIMAALSVFGREILYSSGYRKILEAQEPYQKQMPCAQACDHQSR